MLNLPIIFFETNKIDILIVFPAYFLSLVSFLRTFCSRNKQVLKFLHETCIFFAFFPLHLSRWIAGGDKHPQHTKPKQPPTLHSRHSGRRNSCNKPSASAVATAHCGQTSPNHSSGSTPSTQGSLVDFLFHRLTSSPFSGCAFFLHPVKPPTVSKGRRIYERTGANKRTNQIIQ